MKISASEFREWPYKRLTLMGMSGVGKTHFSTLLATWGWEQHSCDFVIADYLAQYLTRPTTIEDMSSLSEFVGKVGDESKGGLALAEFQKRQKIYYNAECQSLRDGLMVARKGKGKGFVNDSTGSLCEIDDEDLIARVGEGTLIVYLKASQEGEAEVLERAQLYPKPLFYNRDFFTDRLGLYIKEHHLIDASEIDPDDFARWVFPYLFAERIPKYEHIAQRYGVTVESEDVLGIQSEAELLDMIADALEKQEQEERKRVTA